MARHGSRGTTFGMGSKTVLLMGMGLGFVSDAMWYSLGLPGTKTPVNGCSSLKDADILQIMIAGGLTLAGFLMNIKVLPALMFGTLSGMLIPKLITPYLKLPRYILFDYDPATGSIKPVTRVSK